MRKHKAGFDLGVALVSAQAGYVLNKELQETVENVYALRGKVIEKFMDIKDPKSKRILQSAIANNDAQGVKQAAMEGFEKTYAKAAVTVETRVATRNVFKPHKGGIKAAIITNG